VRGRWWHTVRVAGVLWLLSIAAGPMLAFALIFADFPLFWINIVGSVVFALFIPYVAVGQTLLYFDLQGREEEEPVPKRRRLRFWRPGPAPSS
jgi:ABC-type glycerol-3-phosphate transport system permease component